MRGISKWLLVLLSFAEATFSGRILLSDSVVGETSVTYDFLLNFSKEIEQDGRLVIRFPEQFDSEFSVNCKLKSGFSLELGSQKCEYSSTTRMFTITGAFPTTSR